MKRPSKSLRRLLYSLSCLILIPGCSPKPPIEEGDFLDSDLVELVKLDSSILLDIRYATDQNFINKAVYEQPRVFLQRPAAEALVRVHNKLKAQGLGLLVFDGYRPWHLTKLFWDLTPDELREFVASPERGSRHNRGCAVDVTMYHLATGKAVEMTSDFDELNETDSSNYTAGTAEQRRNRNLLITIMEEQGFKVLSGEWWHFDYQGWENYRIENIQFSEIN